MEDPDRDPEAECSVQEYLSKEDNSKLGWMLNKGLTVGKKILVAGFVISSAPIVLPPLAVISIIGFACSLPYGLFLASYACTNKLMSKLLPEPEPPWYLLECGTVSSTDEEVENDGNSEKGEALGLYGYFSRDKEEEEMWEDMRKSVEMRIELVENDENEAYGEGGFLDIGQELVNDNKIVEENRYKEDFDEELELKIGGLGGEEEKQPMLDEVETAIVDIKRDEMSGRAVEGTGTTFEVTNVVVLSHQDADIEEDEDIVRETTGLLKKFREEGMADSGEDNNRSVVKPSGGAEEGDLRVDSQIEVMKFETRNYYANVERVIERKIDENEDYETTAESQEMPETVYVQNVDVIPKEMEPKPVVGDLLATKENEEVLKAEQPTGKVPEEMKPKTVLRDLAAKKESGEVLEAEKSTSEMSGTTNVGGNIMEEQKPVMRKRKASQQEGRPNDNITKNAQQDSQLNRTKEIVIFANADAREIADESGFDLVDTNNVAAQQYSDADFNNGDDVASTKKEKQSSSLAVLESADLMDLPVNAGDSDPNDTGIFSQENIGMDSSKVYLTEEKILEKIEAMRVIVGYKAARQATCLEELKALYLFTGVEPPASFKNPSDLMEVDDKLRFLMSIVGVK